LDLERTPHAWGGHVKKQRRRLVHLVDPATRAPLCGGSGELPSSAAVNGVAVCAECAKTMSDVIADGRTATPIPATRLR
jgi:hypothetical protein